MDKVSDLIKGARLSGRYRVSISDGMRFVSQNGKKYCPLEVAQRELFGRVRTPVENWNADKVAKVLRLPERVIKCVIRLADYRNQDGVTYLRERGY